MLVHNADDRGMRNDVARTRADDDPAHDGAVHWRFIDAAGGRFLNDDGMLDGPVFGWTFVSYTARRCHDNFVSNSAGDWR